jgi:hypothetical protein
MGFFDKVDKEEVMNTANKAVEVSKLNNTYKEIFEIRGTSRSNENLDLSEAIKKSYARVNKALENSFINLFKKEPELDELVKEFTNVTKVLLDDLDNSRELLANDEYIELVGNLPIKAQGLEEIHSKFQKASKAYKNELEEAKQKAELKAAEQMAIEKEEANKKAKKEAEIKAEQQYRTFIIENKDKVTKAIKSLIKMSNLSPAEEARFNLLNDDYNSEVSESEINKRDEFIKEYITHPQNLKVVGFLKEARSYAKLVGKPNLIPEDFVVEDSLAQTRGEYKSLLLSIETEEKDETPVLDPKPRENRIKELKAKKKAIEETTGFTPDNYAHNSVNNKIAPSTLDNIEEIRTITRVANESHQAKQLEIAGFSPAQRVSKLSELLGIKAIDTVSFQREKAKIIEQIKDVKEWIEDRDYQISDIKRGGMNKYLYELEIAVEEAETLEVCLELSKEAKEILTYIRTPLDHSSYILPDCLENAPHTIFESEEEITEWNEVYHQSIELYKHYHKLEYSGSSPSDYEINDFKKLIGSQTVEEMREEAYQEISGNFIFKLEGWRDSIKEDFGTIWEDGEEYGEEYFNWYKEEYEPIWDKAEDLQIEGKYKESLEFISDALDETFYDIEDMGLPEKQEIDKNDMEDNILNKFGAMRSNKEKEDLSRYINNKDLDFQKSLEELGSLSNEVSIVKTEAQDKEGLAVFANDPKYKKGTPERKFMDGLRGLLANTEAKNKKAEDDEIEKNNNLTYEDIEDYIKNGSMEYDLENNELKELLKTKPFIEIFTENDVSNMLKEAKKRVKTKTRGM